MSLWRVPRWPDERPSQRPIILLYHSVARVRTDPWGLRVSPRNFAEQMAVLRQHAAPMPLVEFDRRFSAGDLPPRAVALTFDDGYADNLHAALPVLERHRIPATVFISTGYIGSTQEYWWDQVDQMFDLPGRLPATLELRVGDTMHRWDLGEAANLGAIAALKHRHWRSWHEHYPTQRHRMTVELGNLLRYTTVEAREAALRDLRAWAGGSWNARSTHRAMTSDELKELASAPLIEIGAHTVNHASLSSLSPAAQEREIIESKSWLENALNRSVTSFSYPYGSRNDYTDQTVATLKRTGFERTCSNFSAAIHPGVDRFQYPRRVALDWPGDEFIGWLSKWFAET